MLKHIRTLGIYCTLIAGMTGATCWGQSTRQYASSGDEAVGEQRDDVTAYKSDWRPVRPASAESSRKTINKDPNVRPASATSSRYIERQGNSNAERPASYTTERPANYTARSNVRRTNYADEEQGTLRPNAAPSHEQIVEEGEYAGSQYSGGGCSSCGACSGESCQSGCQCVSCCCRPFQDRLWVHGDYLMWWTKGMSYPPLVTTSTTATDLGVMGARTTSTLYGNDNPGMTAASGYKIDIGYWLNPCQELALEGVYFELGQQNADFAASSGDYSLLARPYYNTDTGLQDSMIIAYHGYITGSIAVNTTIDVKSAEAILRKVFMKRENDQLDFMIGYRYARLNESLRISQDSTVTQTYSSELVAGTHITGYDLFDTTNEFYGGEVGVEYRENVGRWSLQMLMKLGLGNTKSQSLVDGAHTVTTASSSYTRAGNMLAQEDTNMYLRTHNDFAVMPELGMTLGYDLTCRLRATAGYTFWYWSKVVRPAEQLDTSLSQTADEAATGSRSPASRYIMSDFWAQGFNFGLEYKF